MATEMESYNPVAIGDGEKDAEGFSADLGESLMDGLSMHQKAQMRLWRPPKWLSALVISMVVMTLLTFCLTVPGLKIANKSSSDVLGVKSKEQKTANDVKSLQATVELLQSQLTELQTSLTSEQALGTGRDADITSLQTDLSTLQTSAAGTQTGLQQLQVQHNQLMGEVADAVSTINDIDTTLRCNDFAGVLPGGEVLGPLPSNGHYYQLVEITYHIDRDYTSGITWNEAQKDAASRCHNGLRGYLATISSQEEQDFINAMIPPAGFTLDFQYYECWVGGTDVHREGQWMWMDGPEKNTYYWAGGSDGSAIDNHFSNWYCEPDLASWPYCEPNDGNSGQDCMHLYGNGKWNDVACDLRAEAFIVEYGLPVPSPTPRPSF